MCAYVLVAEDDEKQAEPIRRSPPQEGHTATAVHYGGTGPDEARRQQPDFVVLTVDPVRHVVHGDGPREERTPGEYEIVRAVTAEPERVFSRRQPFQRTRGTDRALTGRAHHVHIANLREKSETDPRGPARLLTVFGVGSEFRGARG